MVRKDAKERPAQRCRKDFVVLPTLVALLWSPYSRLGSFYCLPPILTSDCLLRTSRQNARYVLPLFAPFLPPPHAMTMYCVPFTL